MNIMVLLASIGDVMKQNNAKLHEMEEAVANGKKQIGFLLQDIAALTQYKDTIQTEVNPNIFQ